MVLMRPPFGGGSFSHSSGKQYIPNEEGFVEIDESHVPTALAHGFKKVTADEAGGIAIDASKLRRSDLLAYLDDNGLEIPSRATTEDLRELVKQHAEARSTKKIDPEPDPDAKKPAGKKEKK